jgi:hypothetical protein
VLIYSVVGKATDLTYLKLFKDTMWKVDFIAKRLTVRKYAETL